MPLTRLSARDILDSFFQNSPIGMAVAALDGSYLKVNPALCLMVGYTAEELLRLSFQEITHPDDLAAALEQATRLLESDASFFNMEKRYIHKLGHHVAATTYVNLFRDPDDHSPLLYICQMMPDPQTVPAIKF